MKLLTKLVYLFLILFVLVRPSLAVPDFRWDATFLDFEDLINLFDKRHKQTVHIVNYPDSPVVIAEASVSDQGTKFFDEIQGAVNDYKIKVHNNTSRKVLAYQVTWTLKHPFEDYVFFKITTNSINALEPNGDQELEFRRDKHYRDDAYYYAEITKVEFDDDESIWEAPVTVTNSSAYESVKKQIRESKEESADDINLDQVKKNADQIIEHNTVDDDWGD